MSDFPLVQAVHGLTQAVREGFRDVVDAIERQGQPSTYGGLLVSSIPPSSAQWVNYEESR